MGAVEDGIEIVLRPFVRDRAFSTLAGPAAIRAADVGGVADLLRAEVVAVGVAGALAGDDADADAQRDALGRALDDRFVDADGTGGKVFEVEVGVIAARGERFGKVVFQIPPRDAESRRRKRNRKSS